MSYAGICATSGSKSAASAGQKLIDMVLNVSVDSPGVNENVLWASAGKSQSAS